MRSRTVVKVHDRYDAARDAIEVNFALQFAPGVIREVELSRRLDVQPGDTCFRQMADGQLHNDVVQQAGLRLFQSLTAHPPVQVAFNLLTTVPGNDLAPLYIRIDSDQGDRLPWEALYQEACGFLALDRRWPIGRIVGSSLEGSQRERIFEPPLKVMAVLAAGGISAQSEWDALYCAIGQSQIPVKIAVLVCDSQLKGSIESLNDPRIVVIDYVSSAAQLTDRIATFAPHLLHVFCHGSTQDGPHLLLATRNDWDAGIVDRSSISLNPDQIGDVPNIDRHLWLVVLNCCQGATAPLEGRSFARSLVAKGIPAAIAMREIVGRDLTCDFAAAFYPELFRELSPCLAQGQVAIELQWAKALRVPRTQICEKRGTPYPLNKAAKITKEWTLPVLYVNSEPFKLRYRAPNPGLLEDERESLQRELAEVRGYRDEISIQPTTPPQLLAYLDAQIDRIEQRLYAT